MKIGVCIKQVPSGSVQIDRVTGALNRGSAEGVMNPYDRYALEAALLAAQSLGSANNEVIALSMGQLSAEVVLREALAMGAGRAILLSGSAFAGSDVAATSRALAGVFEKMAVPELIFCGQQTTDGDTAQIPFALAARLGIPAIGWVKKIEYFRADGFSVLQELSTGTVRVSGGYPALFAIGHEGVQPRAASLHRRLAAQKMPIAIWGLEELPDPNPDNYGFAGSPTRVRKMFPFEPPIKNPPLKLEPVQAANLLKTILEGNVP